MIDFIFIAGAPGSGKTSVCNLINEEKSWVSIDFGCLRVFHLDRQWSNTSDEEERMSFENLIFILKNYHRYGYKNVLVHDLRDERLAQLPNYLSHDEYNYLIITFIVEQDNILKERVLEPTRGSGFRNFERAIEVNRSVKQRVLVKNEVRLNNTKMTVEETVESALKIVEKFQKKL
ncbi:hypothetical protein I4U23_022560 [Adineta vaga]|nr:hypothetical protein I4U23_022560 [Adineta vaga]